MPRFHCAQAQTLPSRVSLFTTVEGASRGIGMPEPRFHCAQAQTLPSRVSQFTTVEGASRGIGMPEPRSHLPPNANTPLSYPKHPPNSTLRAEHMFDRIEGRPVPIATMKPLPDRRTRYGPTSLRPATTWRRPCVSPCPAESRHGPRNTKPCPERSRRNGTRLLQKKRFPLKTITGTGTEARSRSSDLAE